MSPARKRASEWSLRRLVENVGWLLMVPVLLVLFVAARAIMLLADVVVAVRVWWWKRTIKRRPMSASRAHHRGEEVGRG